MDVKQKETACANVIERTGGLDMNYRENTPRD